MNRVNQIRAGAILSYVQMALSIIINLIYTPFMIKSLGQSEYGLYNTVASTISMLSILNLGFGSSYVKYYSTYRKENDFKKISVLNGTFMTIFLVIGGIALACGLFLTAHLDLVFKNGLTTEEYSIARVLMLLLSINLSISFPMSVFGNIISANERFVFQKLVSMIHTVGGPLVTLPLLLAGYRSIAMVSVSVSISLISYLINGYYVLAVLKNKFTFKGMEKELFTSLFAFTSFIAINLIIDQMNSSLDNLVLARYCGTAEVAVYAVGGTLNSFYRQFSNAVSNVFTPRVHRIVNQTNDNLSLQREQLTALFVKVGRIQYLILALVLTGLIFFGKAFIVYYWTNASYQNAYYVLLLLTVPGTISLIQSIGVEIQRAQNQHQFRSLVYLVMATLNLILTIYLCQIYGCVGAAVGTAISYVIANGVIMNIYYHKKCRVDIICFWKNILSLSKGIVLPVAVGLLISRFVPQSNVVAFCISILIYTLVYCASMYSLGMNNEEKSIIKKPVLKLIRR